MAKHSIIIIGTKVRPSLADVTSSRSNRFLPTVHCARRTLHPTPYTLLLLLLLIPISSRAQDPTPKPSPDSSAQAEQILKSAVDALGATNYLGIRTIVGRGYYTMYRDGQSELPITFIDYVIYPDKERTEFRGRGQKTIQVNSGETGWVYDGESMTLRDMKPPQVAEFKKALRTSVDSLLRGMWRTQGAKISYAGRREAGIAKRNQAVRVVYPDGFTVEFEFGMQDHLPAKIVYKTTSPDNEAEEIVEEDRLAQYVTIDGIFVPLVIDHYRAGVQTSRINYKTIEFNTVIADTLFARPANAKAVK